MERFHGPDGVHLGTVYLTVSDLSRSLSFYRDLLGMVTLPEAGSALPVTSLLALGIPGDREVTDQVYLGTEADDRPLLCLVERPGLLPRTLRTLGLYHLALLLPDRLDLARMVNRLARARWPISGASDHLVSEAIYLSDPDGNGLEIYVDRPSQLWRWESDGIAMQTLPLDLPGLLADFRAELNGWSGLAAGTVIGHIHLHISDLGAAEAFYHGLLGFDLTTRSYPGALFLSARGYHHHIGVNTWARGTVQPSRAEVAGMLAFEVVVPDAGERGRIREDAERRGVEVVGAGEGWGIRDSDGNLVVVRG